MEATLYEEIQSLSGAKEHYEYLDRVITSGEFGEETRSRLRAQLTEIAERFGDDHLYLAVVGEASTGKSTFINALMRDELLVAQALTMTTSAATVIRQGQELTAEFQFRPGTTRRVSMLKRLRSAPVNKKGTRARKKGARSAMRSSSSQSAGVFAAPGLVAKDSEVIRLTHADEPISLPEILGDNNAPGLRAFARDKESLTRFWKKHVWHLIPDGASGPPAGGAAEEPMESTCSSGNGGPEAEQDSDNRKNATETNPGKGEPEVVDGLSLRQAIWLFTTVDEIASTLLSVTVTHTGEFLKDGVCVIDTPGADATKPQHAQVTRDVVERCDAAIIITPAKQIVSNALIKLIENELRITPFLHRCIFLITGIDMIREAERERLIREAGSRLQRRLQLDTLPPVLVASAQSVIDGFGEQEPVVIDEKERNEWQARFEILESDLRANLKRQRALIIAEKLLRLIDDLFHALSAHLLELRERYRAQREALEAAIIPDLPTFAHAQHQECEEKMKQITDEARVHLDSIVSGRQRKLLDRVQKRISSQESAADLRSYVEKSLAKSIARAKSEVRKEVAPHLDGLLSEARSINSVFDQRFSDAYQRLSLIDGDISLQQTGEPTALDGGRLVTGVTGSEALSGPTMEGKVTGGAIGLVVGAVVAGPVGAAIGGYLGSQVSRLFGPSLDERKDQLWSEIRPGLVDQFSETRKQARKAASECCSQLTSDIQWRVDAHVRQYKQTVERMRQEQRQEADHLNRAQESTDAEIHELNLRRQNVGSQLEVLRSLGKR